MSEPLTGLVGSPQLLPPNRQHGHHFYQQFGADSEIEKLWILLLVGQESSNSHLISIVPSLPWTYSEGGSPYWFLQRVIQTTCSWTSYNSVDLAQKHLHWNVSFIATCLMDMLFGWNMSAELLTTLTRKEKRGSWLTVCNDVVAPKGTVHCLHIFIESLVMSGIQICKRIQTYYYCWGSLL